MARTSVKSQRPRPKTSRYTGLPEASSSHVPHPTLALPYYIYPSIFWAARKNPPQKKTRANGQMRKARPPLAPPAEIRLQLCPQVHVSVRTLIFEQAVYRLKWQRGGDAFPGEMPLSCWSFSF